MASHLTALTPSQPYYIYTSHGQGRSITCTNQCKSIRTHKKWRWLRLTPQCFAFTSIIGASEASPLMTPKPHFRPDICIYVWYVHLTANLHLLVQRWPPIRCTQAGALCTEVEGCPPGLHFATAPHCGRWLLAPPLLTLTLAPTMFYIRLVLYYFTLPWCIATWIVYIYRAVKMAALEGTVLERLKSSLLLFLRISFKRNLIRRMC